MKKIELGKIIKARKLDTKALALHLFPWNAHPSMALSRVIKGDGTLDADQISRFSLFTGIPIAELYSGAGWQSRIEGETHVLTCGEYEAQLNTRSWSTKLFHKKSLRHEFVIHSPSITLEEYINTLENEISQIN